MDAQSSPKSAPQSPGQAPRQSLLADPQTAAFAWARYRRLMRWMMLVTLTMVTGAVVVLYRQNGLISIHFYIATALGISFAMLLMSALMGLVFLSNGTGHDHALTDGALTDSVPTDATLIDGAEADASATRSRDEA
jgi:hypothetical protein